MKRNNKKGFTIVELVIVIAVIGILAAVLIPTFSSIITEANKSADLQTARNEYTEYLVHHPDAEIDYVQLEAGKLYNVKNDFEFSTTGSGTILDVTDWSTGGKCDTEGTDGACSVCGK